MPHVVAATIPLFERYRVNWLAEKTGYSVTHLYAIRSGRSSVTSRFRQIVMSVLGAEVVTERALFSMNGRRKGNVMKKKAAPAGARKKKNR